MSKRNEQHDAKISTGSTHCALNRRSILLGNDAGSRFGAQHWRTSADGAGANNGPQTEHPHDHGR